MKPVIILNAPPNAGKDTIAAELSVRLGLPHLEFKGKLFELVQTISGLSPEEWEELYTRDLKEVPCGRLWGYTPRQFMIHVSEDMIKPYCGKDYFGRILGKKALHNGGVVSDSGFNEEADAVVDIVGADRVFCVRFSRDGCDFEGDSRKYVDTTKIIHYLDTENNGTIEDIVNEIKEWVLCLQ